MQDNYRNSNEYGSRRSSRDNEGRGLLDQIKQDVKSWFDSDDDDHEDTRDRSTRQSRSFDDDRYDRSGTSRGYGNYRMEQPYSSDYDDSSVRSSKRVGGYSRDNEYGDYRSGSRDNQTGDRQSRSDNDYYRRNRNDNSDMSSDRPYEYTNAEYQVVPGPYSGRGPKGYQRSSEDLKEQVCQRLENDGRINAGEIEVEVDSCEVTLNGKVPNRDQKRCAEQCAESVRGIKDVHNRLSIDYDMDAQDGQSDTSWRSAGSAGTTASSSKSATSNGGSKSSSRGSGRTPANS